MGCGFARQQARFFARRQRTSLYSLAREVTKRVQAGTGLAHTFNLAPFAANRETHGTGLVVGHQAAQRILRAKLKKISYALTVPHGMHAFCPAHRIFIQIGNVRAGGCGITGIELRVHAAQHWFGGRAHFKSAQAAQRNIAQHAHAGVMKGKAHIEHNSGYTPLAQTFAGFLQHLTRAAQNKLMGRIIVGNIEAGPCGASLVDDIHIGVHGHHACFAGGPCFHFTHVHSACIYDVPSHLWLDHARHAQPNHFTKAVPAKERGAQPQRRKDAPLGIFKHEHIGKLPAREADLFHIGFIHEAQNVPVGHSGKTIHGRTGHGKIVVQLPPHTQPH